mgnify:CR=1 FL=1
MGKINLLTSDIYNKISAGEVVERPSSVVKELVENSIDAGATQISVEISGGGIEKIIVSDNGSGILRDDLTNAFLPHATSKLKEAEDLTRIATLGFRGEALASIAAVSKVVVSTRTETESEGSALSVCGGVIGNVEPCAHEIGTTIRVEDLFFNTPARKKFLKKPSGEASEITGVILRLILANPQIRFKYTQNGEIVFQSQGKGVESAIYAVYGATTVKNLLYVENGYKNFVLKGYVGNSEFTKPNSTYQTLVVNGRYVQNATVSLAVKNAFKPFLMTRSYPFFVLYLEVPSDEIDVNVHPSKMEVRFSDQQSVYTVFYHPIENVLKRGKGGKFANSLLKTQDVPPVVVSDTSMYLEKQPPERIAMSTEEIRPEKFKSNTASQFQIVRPTVEQKFVLQEPSEEDFLVKHELQHEPKLQEMQNAPQMKQVSVLTDTEELTDYTVIGVLFDTYLVLQLKNEMLLIDQHAAHERILFDELQSKWDRAAEGTQILLVPYIFTVKSDEYEFLNDHLLPLMELGFEIQPFGKNTFKINAIPATLGYLNMEKFVFDVLKDIDEIHWDPKLFTKEKLAQTACKHAVKAGDRLHRVQIEYILDVMRKTGVVKCPHGRPVAIKITKTEIEKWFKRIV